MFLAMTDYLEDRSQIVQVSKCESDHRILQYSVPQVSVLGGRRILRTSTEDVYNIFASPVLHHLFADDIQCFCSGSSGEVAVMLLHTLLFVL